MKQASFLLLLAIRATGRHLLSEPPRTILDNPASCGDSVCTDDEHCCHVQSIIHHDYDVCVPKNGTCPNDVAPAVSAPAPPNNGLTEDNATVKGCEHCGGCLCVMGNCAHPCPSVQEAPVDPVVDPVVDQGVTSKDCTNCSPGHTCECFGGSCQCFRVSAVEGEKCGDDRCGSHQKCCTRPMGLKPQCHSKKGPCPGVGVDDMT